MDGVGLSIKHRGSPIALIRLTVENKMDIEMIDNTALHFFEHCLKGLDPRIESNKEIIEEIKETMKVIRRDLEIEARAKTCH